MNKWRAVAATFFCLLFPGLCHAQDSDWNWALPSGIPMPRIPVGNPMSAAKVELGRRLFHDQRLSGNGTISCASCHLQDKAFSDGKNVSIGSTGERTHRNAPALANLAWLATYTWANPTLVSLERQMGVPLFSEDPVEMGIDDRNRDQVLARFRDDPDMAPLFAKAFPGETQAVTFDTIVKSIAAFERSIVSFSSKYDRFRQGGIKLAKNERRGMELFFGNKAQCHTCHGGFLFADQTVFDGAETVPTPFHDIGLYAPNAYPFPNRGLFEFTGRQEDKGKFRAPSLRNVALSAPYMHDGSMATLPSAIDAHDGIKLSAAEKADLVAFLKMLTDELLLSSPNFSKSPPQSPL